MPSRNYRLIGDLHNSRFSFVALPLVVVAIFSFAYLSFRPVPTNSPTSSAQGQVKPIGAPRQLPQSSLAPQDHLAQVPSNDSKAMNTPDSSAGSTAPSTAAHTNKGTDGNQSNAADKSNATPPGHSLLRSALDIVP